MKGEVKTKEMGEENGGERDFLGGWVGEGGGGGDWGKGGRGRGRSLLIFDFDVVYFSIRLVKNSFFSPYSYIIRNHTLLRLSIKP